MPTTHHVISQIYQKFLNGCNIINNAMINATIFTATIIKDGTIFIAQRIIQASGFIYNKIGQGINKIGQTLQQIPTAVTAGLIASTILLVAAKQFG